MAKSGAGARVSRGRRVAPTAADEPREMLNTSELFDMEGTDVSDELYNTFREFTTALNRPVHTIVGQLEEILLALLGFTPRSLAQYTTMTPERQLKFITKVIGYSNKLNVPMPTTDPVGLAQRVRSAFDMDYQLARHYEKSARLTPRDGAGVGASTRRRRRVANIQNMDVPARHIVPAQFIDEDTGKILKEGIPELQPNRVSNQFFNEVYEALLTLDRPVLPTVLKIQTRLKQITGLSIEDIPTYLTAREDRKLEILSLLIGYSDRILTPKSTPEPSTLASNILNALDLQFAVQQYYTREARREPIRTFERREQMDAGGVGPSTPVQQVAPPPAPRRAPSGRAAVLARAMGGPSAPPPPAAPVAPPPAAPAPRIAPSSRAAVVNAWDDPAALIPATSRSRTRPRRARAYVAPAAPPPPPIPSGGPLSINTLDRYGEDPGILQTLTNFYNYLSQLGYTPEQILLTFSDLIKPYTDRDYYSELSALGLTSPVIFKYLRVVISNIDILGRTNPSAVINSIRKHFKIPAQIV